MVQTTPTVCLIGGKGKMGVWFSRFFERQGVAVTVVDKDNLDDGPFRISESDIVIICVPISQTAEAIRLARQYLSPGTLLTDVTSLKTEPVKEMSLAPESVGVLGMHPLFGSLVTSLQNQVIVFTPVRDNQWVDYLRQVFEADGAQIVTLTPEEHDRQMSAVQVMTHVINTVFIRVLGRLGFTNFHNLSTPVFRLQTILAGRVLGGDPRLYSELAVYNPFSGEIAGHISEEMEKMKDLIQNVDKESYMRAISDTASQIADYIPIAKNKSSEILSFLDSRSKIRIAPTVEITSSEVSQIFVLGPAGTFSHRAAENLFSTKDEAMIELEPTISGVFSSVLQDESSVGVVPIENSTQGMVQETLDNLLQYPLQVIGSYTMPINLALLGRTDNLEGIETIRSHPQPLAQSRNWLATHYPEAKLETAASSVEAILATEDPTVAFVAHKDVAKEYGLRVLAENIQDKKNNETQFYCIAPGGRPHISQQLGAEKTLLLLTVHDSEGVLRDILNAFADRGLNLSRLDSHRSEVPDWDYYFFLEVEALPEDPPLQDALREIDACCYTIRLLGVS